MAQPTSRFNLLAKCCELRIQIATNYGVGGILGLLAIDKERGVDSENCHSAYGLGCRLVAFFGLV